LARCTPRCQPETGRRLKGSRRGFAMAKARPGSSERANQMAPGSRLPDWQPQPQQAAQSKPQQKPVRAQLSPTATQRQHSSLKHSPTAQSHIHRVQHSFGQSPSPRASASSAGTAPKPHPFYTGTAQSIGFKHRHSPRVSASSTGAAQGIGFKHRQSPGAPATP
jgi:hypothetical protein